MYEDPKSKISQLEKVLDSREDRVSRKIRRHELKDKDITVSQDWNQDEFKAADEETLITSSQPASSSLATKILIGSVIFFIITVGIVAYNFLGGNNVVSGNNIDVTVKAPVSVAGGDVVPFEIDITNNNSVTLSGADLGVEFPSGAQQADNVSLPAKRIQDFIGDILPGQTIKKNMSIALFGSENEKKDIKITLEYKVAGSNSLFNKAKVVSILVSSSPVSISVNGPTEVNTNQSADFSVDVTSNSPTVIKNILLKVDYPFGFTFTGSAPNFSVKNNLWLLGDLAPGAKRTIKFQGVLFGQEGEERGFNFSVGSQSATDNSVIGVPYTTSFSSITIRRPFVSADISLNGDNSSNYVSSAGSKVEAVIKWQNNLPYEVSNVAITVKLSGNAIDKSSIQADGGFYQSVANTIIFNQTTDKTFLSLAPGQSGENKFTLSSFGPSTVTGSGLTNPTIILDISVSGQRVGYTTDQADALFSDSRKIKLTSNPQLLTKVLYYVGPFQNSGPIPPKAEQETTYTVTWTITNPLNSLSGTQVTAILPPYMKWLGAVSPSSEKINYNDSTGLVTWNVGNIVSGAGIFSAAREASFQVSFLPSVSQIGMTPDLVGEAALNAKDNFTATAVSSNSPALNTRLSNDPYFKINNETVVQ